MTIFRNLPDGDVAVTEWPEEAWFTYKFLEQSSPTYFKRNGDEFSIIVKNGMARYWIVADDVMENMVFAKLVESQLDGE